ncbi:ATP-dependent RNA helicase, putative [Plasmodium malariae]|uniref:ATP-dependent RNA helicase, putative n=1 Tax=Plasmodium malariae TaxID=5858 RepID=A0A1A8W7V3_PLAMA|nr:ATP-dependent RNA helicase, putative [Plasmodium malariae]
MTLHLYAMKSNTYLKFPLFNRKLICRNKLQIIPFCNSFVKCCNYSTLKIPIYHFIFTKNVRSEYIIFHHRYNMSRDFLKGDSIIRENRLSISYNNKIYSKLSKENISESKANKEEVQNEKKLSNKKEEEEHRNKIYMDGKSTYNVRNKILNRHENIDLSILNIDEEIMNNLKYILKIDKLYMYQYIIFNEILVKNSKHILVYNKTGTGKTLSYLLPLIQRLLNEKFHCSKKILILTQNIYLCKQLYIYILSIYPNLNVCILFDDNDSYGKLKGRRHEIIDKEYSIKNTDEKNEDLYKENYGIHFFLSTPNKLEYYIKNYKNKKKNEKNVMNNILNCVDTIVVDEFDYIIENRKLIFNFLFKKNVLDDKYKEIRSGGTDINFDKFNYENFNIYLFTANVNELIKRKINDHLSGFIFFDFINGFKEIVQNKINVERSTIFKNSEHIIQLVSKENKSSSLCNLNISHFICKINTPSKYKYVSYFLNEFFFLNKKKNRNKSEESEIFNDINCEERDSNKLIFDYMNRNDCDELENEEKINKCIIFANTKEEVEKLHENSFLKPHSVMMHAELLTEQKNENINLFKLGKKTILITTDIVSRGIDIDNVIFVLNYSPPTSPYDYVHRSGRTGRAKEKGVCLTMYHKYEYKSMDKIKKYTKNNFQVILCPHIEEVFKFSVDTLTETIMKIEPEKYEFLNNKSKELLKEHDTKIIAQILSVLLKFDRKSYNVSLLSGKKNYIAILIKDPFFEVIKNKDDIINFLKATTGIKNISNIVGDTAKCDEGFIADICSTHVNKIIKLFKSSNSEYKKKMLDINTLIELPPIINEKKSIIRKNRKIPWIK